MKICYETCLNSSPFSAGHPDTHSSHCSPHLPIPCTLLTQIAPSYLADLWPSGRLLEPAPSLRSLMDSLVNSLTIIISVPSSLFLTHFLYKYSLWKKNLSRCSLDRACSWSLCFSVHTIALLFLLFVGKKRELFHCSRAAVSLRKASGSWCKGGLTVSRWLQRRRVMWGEIMQVPWGQWE